MNEDLWEVFGLLLLCVAICGVFALFMVKSFNPPERKFYRLYQGLDIAPRKTHGRVAVRFQTYDGLLAWYTQTEHRGYLNPTQARQFVGRMLRYNLIWGTLCAGGLFVLILTIAQYIREKRSITRQAAHPDTRRRTPNDQATELTEFYD